MCSHKKIWSCGFTYFTLNSCSYVSTAEKSNARRQSSRKFNLCQEWKLFKRSQQYSHYNGIFQTFKRRTKDFNILQQHFGSDQCHKHVLGKKYAKFAWTCKSWIMDQENFKPIGLFVKKVYSLLQSISDNIILRKNKWQNL